MRAGFATLSREDDVGPRVDEADPVVAGVLQVVAALWLGRSGRGDALTMAVEGAPCGIRLTASSSGVGRLPPM